MPKHTVLDKDTIKKWNHALSQNNKKEDMSLKAVLSRSSMRFSINYNAKGRAYLRSNRV
jgi:hypothetical protein